MQFSAGCLVLHRDVMTREVMLACLRAKIALEVGLQPRSEEEYRVGLTGVGATWPGVSLD